MSLRTAPRVGPVVGIKVGINGDASSSAPPAAYTGTIDAGSGRPAPSSSAEWTSFIAAYGLSVAVPGHLHLCQEASGNLAATIGGLTLTASGTVLYQKSVAGWARKGVGGNFLVGEFTNAAGPSVSTTSTARFAWLAIDAGADFLNSALMANGTNMSGWGLGVRRVAGGLILRIRGAGGFLDSAAAYVPGVAYPMLMVNDNTGGRMRLYTPFEKLAPAWSLPAVAGRYGIGGVAGGTFAPSAILHEAGWQGAAAEISDANAKALIEAMWGLPVPWS